MMTLVRMSFRSALRLFAVLLALFTLQVALLAFPQLLTSQKARAGHVTIHYDGVHNPGIEELAAEVNQRLVASGLYEPQRRNRVFVFRNRSLYALVARLAMVPPEAQGFALSLVGNAFVSESRVAALGARTGGLPRYSVWEGSLAHTIAHELAHLHIAQRIGRDEWRELPHWKQEGLPEYISNIGPIRDDSHADLGIRFRALSDDQNWSSSRRWDQTHFEAGLLIEFLIEIRGLDLTGVLADSVTRNETLAALRSWADKPE